MYAWEAIEQSLTFIEEHLTEEIYTEELANIAGLSPFYFQRLFKRLVNKPVQEYVKLRRLAKVIENLGNTKQRILDVALDYGFYKPCKFYAGLQGNVWNHTRRVQERFTNAQHIRQAGSFHELRLSR